MAKPRVIIADTEESYIAPLQLKFIEDFFEKVDLEIITDENYFSELFSTPQQIDILIVSESLYDRSLSKHDISHVFLMTEHYEEELTAELTVNRIFKYTSIKEIFNEIIGKSNNVFHLKVGEKKETQVVLVYSACGGVGKTTVAMGISACLTKNYKRVLYINADRLQFFHGMLENMTSISNGDVYAKLANPTDRVYSEIKHVIRKELFSYLPPFKGALMSLGLQYSLYEKIILSAKASGDYDFIVVDADVTFDEDKARLFSIADKVVVVTNQTISSTLATNILVSNMNGVNAEKYLFVCNNFNKDTENALISPNIILKFTVSDYVEHFHHFENMKAVDLARESSMQKIAFLIV